MPPRKERRFEREEIVIHAQIWVQGGFKYTCGISDISPVGARVRLEENIDTYSRVRLFIKDLDFEADGEVVRVVKLPAGFEMGLKFYDPQPRLDGNLLGYKLRAKGLP